MRFKGLLTDWRWVLGILTIASAILTVLFRLSLDSVGPVKNASVALLALAAYATLTFLIRAITASSSAELDHQLELARKTLDAPDDRLNEALGRFGMRAVETAVGDDPARESEDARRRDLYSISLLRSEFASTKVQPAWDVARTTLEKYWARNLNQNAFIFITSIFASALGFAVTLWGVYSAINHQAPLGASILAAASGAVTQIIGTTFLVIYRSTAQQALEFNRTLERINSVGMAWYVLQTMSEETDAHRKAKDAAKAALVLSVVAAGGNAAVVVASDKDEKSDSSGSTEKK